MIGSRIGAAPLAPPDTVDATLERLAGLIADTAQQMVHVLIARDAAAIPEAC